MKKLTKHLFPKNYRFITEQAFWLRLISVLGGIIVVLLLVFLVQAYVSWNKVQADRQEIASKIKLWENIVAKYPTYRDAYFQLAILSFQIGDKKKEASYIQKVLEIDPRFTPAKTLEHISNLESEKDK